MNHHQVCRVWLWTWNSLFNQCEARRRVKQLKKHPGLHVLDVPCSDVQYMFMFPSLSGLITFIRCFGARNHLLCFSLFVSLLFSSSSFFSESFFLTHYCEAPIILCFLRLKRVTFDKKKPGWMPQLCTSTPSPASRTPVKWILAVGTYRNKQVLGVTGVSQPPRRASE